MDCRKSVGRQGQELDLSVPATGGVIQKRIQEALNLHLAGRQDEAATAYADILKDDPTSADAWHLLGLIAQERHQEETAVTLIEKAMVINPANPVYHHNVATVLARLGRLDAARRNYHKAIHLNPAYAEAYYNLSGIEKFETGSPLVDDIETLLATAGLDDRNRCFLHFAAGKLLDDVGAFDRAFGHYQAGNAAKGARYDAIAHTRLADDLIATFTRPFVEAHSASGNASDLPVFIVGAPRSGTSLVEQILASHPVIFGAGELRFIETIATKLPAHGAGSEPYPRCLGTTGAEVIGGYAEAYLKQLTEMAAGASRVIDKNPLNFQHMGLIALLFPKARIIHCRRDPRDTAISCFFQNFTVGQEWAFALADIATFLGLEQRLMSHWRTVLPLQFLEVEYESLIADPEDISRRMVAFCGVEWDDACLAEL